MRALVINALTVLVVVAILVGRFGWLLLVAERLGWGVLVLVALVLLWLALVAVAWRLLGGHLTRQ